MRARAALVVQGVLWRRAGSVAVLLAAALAFAASCLGPLWATASEDALGTATVAAAPPAERALRVGALANQQGPLTEAPGTALALATRSAALPPSADPQLSVAHLSLATTVPTALDGGAVAAVALLTWDDRACGWVVEGSCPAGRDQVLLSVGAARLLGLRVGAGVTLPALASEPAASPGGVAVVAGLYAPPPAGEQPAGAAAPVGSDAAVLDPLVVSRSLLEGLRDPVVRAEAVRLLVPGERTAPQRAALARTLEAWEVELRSQDGRLEIDPAARRLLTAIAADGAVARHTARVLGLQLLVLSCVGLAAAVSSAVEARSADTALGVLRGLRRRTVLGIAAGESLLLVVLALPVGATLGTGATALVAGVALPSYSGLRPDAALAWSLFAALVGALVAVLVGVRRVLTRPLLDQLGGAGDGAAPGTSALVAEVAVGALAAAALVQVAAGDASTGAGLFAPALAGLALGVLAARAVRAALGLAVRRAADRGGPVTFLALRSGARGPGGTAGVALVAVAAALALYAAGVLGVAGGQRSAQAAMETGAPAVYEVAPVPVARLLAAVQRADPDGHRLAAAVVRADPGTAASDQEVAVDAARLAQVAGWRSGWSDRPLAALAAALRPPLAPSVLLRGRAVTVALTADPDPASPPAELGIDVLTPDGRQQRLRLGPLAPGPQELTAELPACPAGCPLLALAVLPSTEGDALEGALRVDGVAVDGRALSPDDLDAAGWRPLLPYPRVRSGQPPVVLDAGPLSWRYRTTGGAAAVQRADAPEQLPVVLAGSTVLARLGQDGLVQAPALDGEVVPATVVGAAQVVPGLGSEGVLTDLSAAARAGSGVSDGARYEVWSADPATAGTAAALVAAGLQVTGERSTRDRTAALGRTGSARSLLLLWAVALTALAVTALALLARALSTARRRAAQAEALAAVGVPRGVSRRAELLEQLGRAAAGLVAGGTAAALALELTVDDVVRAGLGADRAPLPEHLPALALLGAAGAAAAVLSLVALACARAGTGPTRLPASAPAARPREPVR